MRAPRWTVPAQSKPRRVATTMPAAADAEVERLVEAFAAVLEQHVLAGDARGRPRRTARRSARPAARTMTSDTSRPAGRQDQLARGLRILGRHDARAREQRQRFVEDAALGQGDRERGHGRERRLRRRRGTAILHGELARVPVVALAAGDVRRADRAVVAERHLHASASSMSLACAMRSAIKGVEWRSSTTRSASMPGATLPIAVVEVERARGAARREIERARGRQRRAARAARLRTPPASCAGSRSWCRRPGRWRGPTRTGRSRSRGASRA